MRNSILFAVALAIATVAFADDNEPKSLPPPPVGMHRISAVYDKTKLVATFKNHNASLNLPQFYVVDLSTGQQARTHDLPAAFAAFTKKNETSPQHLMQGSGSKNGKLLDALLGVSRHANGTPLRKSDLDNMRFAAFEFWASWCSGCLQEASELSDLLQQHPMPGLAWVAVETDPMKAMDIDPKTVSHTYVGPDGKPLKLGPDGKPVLGPDGKPVEE